MDWNPRLYLPLPRAYGPRDHFATSACTNTEYVEVEQPRFNPPPDSVAGFLGLYDVPTNQTTCGNCHTNNQTEWSGTKHAGAYATLANNPGHNRPVLVVTRCLRMETYTRPTESPEAGTPYPIPSTTTCSARAATARGSHTSPIPTRPTFHSPARWSLRLVRPASAVTPAHITRSRRSGPSRRTQPFAMSRRTGRNPVLVGAACHSGAGAMAKLSGNAPTNYIGKEYAVPDHLCRVSRPALDAVNSGQLRAPIDNPEITANLCTSCHVRGAEATPSFTITSRGAHASQGAVYFGEAAGWTPPGFVFDPNNPVQTSHVTANQRLCAGCHVVKFTTTDLSTGQDFTSVGHLFSPDPCKDANGLPTIEAIARTLQQRDSGLVHELRLPRRRQRRRRPLQWHARRSPGTDRHPMGRLGSRYSARNDRRRPAAGGCWRSTRARQWRRPIRPGTAVPSIPRTTTCQWPRVCSSMPGAWRGVYGHNDGSKGIHNKSLYLGLIAGSINAVQDKYGLPEGAVIVPEGRDPEGALGAGNQVYPTTAPRQTAGR